MRQLKILKQITNRETRSLDRYLVEIGRLDMIDPVMEADLAKRIREGDVIAREKLIKANVRFVVSVAKQYQNFGLSLGDLINEGNLGLMKAAQRFDETRGFKFISYAVWWIRQSIMDSLAQNSRLVRLPINRLSLLTKMLNSVSRLEQSFQREPSPSEVAQSMGASEKDIIESQYQSRRHLSMDSPLAEGEDSTLYEVLADTSVTSPDRELDQDSLKIEIRRVLDKLPKKESEIISLYFGLSGSAPLSLEDLGKRFSLTRERVRQIKEKASRRFFLLARENSLRTYL